MMEEHTLQPGWVVHVSGIPVRIERPVKVTTSRENWKLILDDLYAQKRPGVIGGTDRENDAQ